MAERPTYETEGTIERFDERNTVFSREAFVWGSPEETEYHRRNPEKLGIDRQLASFINVKMEPVERQDPDAGAEGIPQATGETGRGGSGDRIGQAIYESLFVPPASLALPDMVDGEPAATKVQWPPGEAARRIKDYARRLGADDVRIGPLRQEWVYTHRGSRPFFHEGYRNAPYFAGIPGGYQGARYGDSITLAHGSAISMAFRQDKGLVGTGSTRAVDFEVGRVYAGSVLASVQLARFIRSLGYPARAHHLRNYLIMLVPVAVDAGIGELARTGYVVSRSLGANFRLSAVTTDLQLAHDAPVDIGMQDFCNKCMKCATNCPSQAIPKGEKTLVRGVWKWKLDEEACLLYWGRTGYTCGICQTICPWTKPQNAFHRSVATLAVNAPWLRRGLVLGDDIVYGARFRPTPVPEWLENTE